MDPALHYSYLYIRITFFYTLVEKQLFMEYDKTSIYRDQMEEHGADFIVEMKNAYDKANILPLIQDLMQSGKKIRILEFGPGLGLLAEQILKYSANIEYHITDIDEAILNELHLKNGSIVPHHITSLTDFKKHFDDTFDIIIAIDVWEHLPNNDLIEYTNSTINLLNDTGIFIAQVPNWGCPFAPNNIYASDITHQNMFNENSAKQLLLMSGLDESCIEILPYKFPQTSILWKIRSIIRYLLTPLFYLLLFIMGVMRLRIITPNLIMKVDKGNCYC